MSKLNTPGARSPFSQLSTRAIFSVLSLLVALCVCQNAPAQNLQPRAVARLITAPTSDSGRPRRVTPTVNSAGATKSVGAVAPDFDSATAVERRAFEQANAMRAENGLSPLTWDPELCLMAREHSEQMAKLGYFSHETPEGLQLKDRAHENGILHFRVIGENIAYNKGYDDPGGFAVERWMTSAGHRANMLYAGFEASAIGSYVAADGSTFLTQVFIAR